MKALNIGAMVLGLFMATSAAAQTDMTTVVAKVSAARQENAQKTRNYSWTQRTEVKVKGEVKSLKTEIVRYTVDGEMQKTPIDETSAKKAEGHSRQGCQEEDRGDEGLDGRARPAFEGLQFAY